MNVMNWVLVEIQSLKRDLQFPTFSGSAASPVAWALGDQLISGFQFSLTESALVQAPTNPRQHADYFFQVHPNLSLIQICHLVLKPQFLELFDVDYFFSRWGKGQRQNAMALCESLTSSPEALQAWFHEKDLRPQDLAPWRALPKGEFNFLTENFLKARPSKSEGVQIIEWTVDLLLMGTAKEALLEKFQGSAAEVLKNLKALRYPQTSTRDLKWQDQMQLSWPSNLQARFQRRGDRSGYDLQFFVTNPVELQKTLMSLEKVIKEWNTPSPHP